jgi:hypothetical protein
LRWLLAAGCHRLFSTGGVATQVSCVLLASLFCPSALNCWLSRVYMC